MLFRSDNAAGPWPPPPPPAVVVEKTPPPPPAEIPPTPVSLTTEEPPAKAKPPEPVPSPRKSAPKAGKPRRSGLIPAMLVLLVLFLLGLGGVYYTSLEMSQNIDPPTVKAASGGVAGTTATRSADRDSWMWPISASSVREKRSA